MLKSQTVVAKGTNGQSKGMITTLLQNAQGLWYFFTVKEGRVVSRMPVTADMVDAIERSQKAVRKETTFVH